MVDNDQPTGPKVFDVSKPGTGAQQIGSKPMVVGHTVMQSDPMMREDTVTNQLSDRQKDKAPIVEPPAKKVIKPLSEEEKKIQESINDTVVDTTENPNEKVVVAATPEEKSMQSMESAGDSLHANEKVESAKEVDPVTEAQDRQNSVKKLIASKKYFVSVQESRKSNAKTFIVVFLVTLTVGLAVIAAFIDAEILDIGITLPFDFL